MTFAQYRQIYSQNLWKGPPECTSKLGFGMGRPQNLLLLISGKPVNLQMHQDLSKKATQWSSNGSYTM